MAAAERRPTRWSSHDGAGSRNLLVHVAQSVRLPSHRTRPYHSISPEVAHNAVILLNNSNDRLSCELSNGSNVFVPACHGKGQTSGV